MMMTKDVLLISGIASRLMALDALPFAAPVAPRYSQASSGSFAPAKGLAHRKKKRKAQKLARRAQR